MAKAPPALCPKGWLLPRLWCSRMGTKGSWGPPSSALEVMVLLASTMSCLHRVTNALCGGRGVAQEGEALLEAHPSP